jgi:O-antigen/teichoic acid export membrane protein
MPHLLSTRWDGVGDLILWLTPVAVIQIVSQPTWQASKALGELRSPLVGGLIGLAIQIGLVAAAAPHLGLLAYPVAATVGSLAATTVVFVRVARRIGANPLRAIVPIAAGLLTAVAMWGAALLWLTSPTSIVLVFAGGLVVHLVIVVVFAGAYLAALLRFVGAAAPRRISVGLGRLAGVVERMTTIGGTKP